MSRVVVVVKVSFFFFSPVCFMRLIQRLAGSGKEWNRRYPMRA